MRIAYLDNERIDIRNYDLHLKRWERQGIVPLLTCAEGHPVIPRRGMKNQHHFAHKALTSCSCHDNKGEWHLWHQDRLCNDVQEVRISTDTRYHIADACVSREYLPESTSLKCKGYVIEYQHSPMDIKTMRQREQFYTGQGYHLVWVFDTSSWEINIIRKNGNEITFRKRRGKDHPLDGAYQGSVTKIFDFNKSQLLVVTSQSGMLVTGRVIELTEFDQIYIGSAIMPDADTRPFHHAILN